jgi:hypothetical protein
MGLMRLAIDTVADTLSDVLPVVVFLVAFHRLVLGQRLMNLLRLLTGLVLVVVGLGLFVLGLEEGLFPLGRLMAEQLTAPGIGDARGNFVPWSDYGLLLLFAFAVAFGTTIAEPALLAVAIKARAVSGGTVSVWGLRFAVALGVATGVALGCLRLVAGTPLHWYILVGYAVVVAQTMFAPKEIVPLAYDSGGVSTSTVTVPLVTALGLGLAENVPGRVPLLDGFGLIAFACLFPIMSVLGYAQFTRFLDRRTASRDRRSTHSNHSQ